MPPVTFQNNTITDSEITVNLNGSNYVENFTEVESIIEQLFPENLQKLLKPFGNIVKADLSISSI